MNRRNGRQDSHLPTTKLTGRLVCPYCQTSFRLTWRRYLSSTWGNYRCPQCRQVSYLKDDSSWLWPIRIAAVILYVMLCINVFSYTSSNSGVVGTLIPERLFVLLISLVVGVVIDKWIEGHMRHLRIRSLHGLMAVLLALFTGCVVNLGGHGVRGAGILRTESRSVSGFSSIVFKSEGKVTVQQTGKESLTISAEDNLLPLLKTSVTSGILSIRTVNNVNINPTKPIEFVIEVKSLEGFSMNGAGDIKAKGIQGKQLTIALTGAGDMTIEGSADSLDLNLKGVGSYDGKDFKTKQAKVHSEGVGNAVLNVSDQLDISVSGIGEVEYIGSPKVQKSGEGLGRIKQRIINPN
jgi:Putative auto-transporter adhesin, head GIN domain